MISVILSLLTLGFLGAECEKKFTFSQEAGVFRWGNSELIVEAMMPDFGHIVPVVDNTMFDGVVKLEDTLFGLGFFTHVAFLVIHAHHDIFVLWSTHKGWE
jgi:hypothetical protein